MEKLIPPVFCDQCPLLALALLDGDPICGECLLAAVARGGAAALDGRIEPLPLQKPFWWRGWCCPMVVDVPPKAALGEIAG